LSGSVRSFVVGSVATFVAAAVLFVPAFARADATTVSGTASSKLGVKALHVGDHGSRVKTLQQLLTKAGFKTPVDGQYGSGTADVVRRFQRAANLKATGVADPATLTALQRATDGSAAKNTSGGYDVRSVGTSSWHLGDRIPLRLGMSGHDVKILQDFLRRAGFKTSVDGEFGSGTIRSVKQFETDQQVTVDGVVDAPDIDLLRSLVSGESGTPTTAPAKAAPLAPGDQATVGTDGLAIAPQNAPPAVQQIGRQRDREEDLRLRRRPRQVGGLGLRLLGVGLLRAARRRPPRPGADVGRFRILGRTGPGAVGDHLRQQRPRVHGGRRAALRHERPSAGRHALAHQPAVEQRLHGGPPTGALTRLRRGA
jgi:peptidoglycan hydrolase-like protein with peptidoglycan-binding domain